jgi:hypothetical protein
MKSFFIKEHTRGVICTLPFAHIPRRLKVEFIYIVVLGLNAFSEDGDICNLLTSRTAGALAVRLQTTLSSAPRNVLQG